MRSPLAFAARWIQSRRREEPPALDIQTLKNEIAEAVNRVSVELTRQLERKLEERLGAVHSSLRERLDELYSETWRLRDAIDSRLGLVEQRLEESASRVESSILEVHASAASVKETCQSLARTFERQFSSTEEAVAALKQSYERRLRQLEASQSSRLAAIEREHQQALLSRSGSGSQRYVIDRVRSLAEQMLQEIERAAPNPGLRGARESVLGAAIQRIARRLQGDRAEQLESAFRAFAQRLLELGQVEEETRPQAAIPVSPGLAEKVHVSIGPKVNGNGNGNGHHAFDLPLGELARG